MPVAVREDETLRVPAEELEPVQAAPPGSAGVSPAPAAGVSARWERGAPGPASDGWVAPSADDGLPPASRRDDQAATRLASVERVIQAMGERLDEPLSLGDMADIVSFSPYHFNRIFRQVTGVPPCRFLTALRLEAAKQLLLTTSLSVTDICYEVGYNSLGTFTTQFSELVGLAPGRLRRLAQEPRALELAPLLDRDDAPRLHGQQRGARGRVHTPDGFVGLIFVGLFPGPLPQGRPVGCCLLGWPGPFQLPPVADGRYAALAVGLPRSVDAAAYLLPGRAARLVGADRDLLLVRGGRPERAVEITLRSPRVTDPPLLVAVPQLIGERLAAG